MISIGIKKNSHILFGFCMSIMILLIAIRNLSEIDFPIAIFLCIGAVIAFLCSKDEIIAAAIACIPLSPSFQYKYFIMILLIGHFFRFNKRIYLSKYILPVFLMAAWELLHSFIGVFSINEYIRGFVELIFLVYLFCQTDNEYDYKLITRTLAICTIAMCSIMMYMKLQETDFNIEAIFANGMYRFGRMSDIGIKNKLSYNQNQLGQICNLSVICLLRLLFEKRGNLFDIIMIIIISMFGFTTMSRAFLACYIVIMVSYAFLTGNNIKRSLLNVFLISMLCILIFWILKNYMPFVIENFRGRFEVKDVTGGRTDLFEYYNKFLISEPWHLLFGVGVQDINDKVAVIMGSWENVPHNGIQEILLAWGIPGLIMFIWLLVNMIKRSKISKTRRTILNYLPALIILFYTQSGQLITSSTELIGLSLAYISLINSKETENLGDLETL